MSVPGKILFNSLCCLLGDTNAGNCPHLVRTVLAALSDLTTLSGVQAESTLAGESQKCNRIVQSIYNVYGKLQKETLNQMRSLYSIFYIRVKSEVHESMHGIEQIFTSLKHPVMPV